MYWMSAHALMCMCALGLASGSAHRSAGVGGVKVRVWSGFRKRGRSSKRMCWFDSVHKVWEAGALIEAHEFVCKSMRVWSGFRKRAPSSKRAHVLV